MISSRPGPPRPVESIGEFTDIEVSVRRIVTEVYEDAIISRGARVRVIAEAQAKLMALIQEHRDIVDNLWID